MRMTVSRTQDFTLTGTGRQPAWEKAEWQILQPVGTKRSNDQSQVKILYSDKGLYFFFRCDYKKLVCPLTKDFEDLYQGDVVEIFLCPDESQDLYLEYELSPMNAELLLLVPNNMRHYGGWIPWHYEGEGKCQHQSAVSDDQWTAEIFIPFGVFKGMRNSLPVPGTVWRANLYRMDYDQGEPDRWAWCPETGIEFHDYKNFGTLLFN